jgi:N-acetyl-gamma-glutamyl-phosphate reductase
MKKKVAIVGATGYSGIELIALLANHPKVSIRTITSNSHQGERISDIYPGLRNVLDIKLVATKMSNIKECDIVFFATPNGIASKYAVELLNTNKKIIDLAADFRLNDIKQWDKHYNIKHPCPKLLEKAIYGLPELNREKIKKTNLLANPGCYPTATLLAIAPLLIENAIKTDDIVVDAKSGISGAGRGFALNKLFCETSENLAAYKIAGHRHLPEIQQEMVKLNSHNRLSLTFVPHLIPMKRGILVTIYAKLKQKKQKIDLQKLYETRYNGEFFVDIMPQGIYPQTKSVTNSNICRISINKISARKIVIVAVIDNLIKGAAGQAIQNMNIMCGFDEKLSLTETPVII